MIKVILTSFDDLWPLEWPLPTHSHWLLDATAIWIVRKPEAFDSLHEKRSSLCFMCIICCNQCSNWGGLGGSRTHHNTQKIYTWGVPWFFNKTIIHETSENEMKGFDCCIQFRLKIAHVTSYFIFMCFAHYNQSHTILLSLGMQWPIRDVQISHRWILFRLKLANSLSISNKSADVRTIKVKRFIHHTDYKRSYECLNTN